MKYILAIDQGTTGSRAIVYDEKGKVVSSSYEEFPQYFPRPGWVEHDPDEIWQSVNNSIQKALSKIDTFKIAAIGITNQRETTVIWDKKTGKPVYRAIVWQCRRTAERCKKLTKQSKMIRQKTGLPVDAYFSATKIEWILKNAKIKNIKDLLFGTTDTWLLWKLTGGKSHATDYTNASRTMIFNIKKLEWDDGLLRLFDIPKYILPKVQKSSSVFGKTVKIGKLPPNIPITGIAGDQQAALFGQACFKPGTIKSTYGTGCFMLLNIGKKLIYSKNGLITTLACDKKGNPVYALEGSVFIAGASIQWLRDKLGIIKYSADSENLAKSLTSNEGVYFVPAFVGLGAPYWDQDARGLICGLTRGTKRAHIVRAALESMCYSTKDVLDAMRKDSGLKIRELKVDGGASANDFLLQFQADILDIKVIRPKIIESTSRGAAYLAGLAVNWKKDRVFIPKMKKPLAVEYYKGWQKAVVKALT